MAIPTARTARKSLGGDRLELGSLPGDSQELIGDLPHAGKASYLRGQLNADDLKLVKRGSGVFTELCGVLVERWGWRVLVSDLSVQVKAELVTDSSACKGLCSRRGAGKNSAHPLSCAVASTRRGTTTDWDYSACGKRYSSRCRDQGGHPRRHHVATAGHVWTGQGRTKVERSRR